MAPSARGLWAVLALLVLVEPFVGAADAKIPVIWSRKRKLASCEPPHVFYSSQHVAGRKPCCATIEGMCAGGVACPGSGVCPTDANPCTAQPVASRPNIILFISDDQGACHYGNSVECRST